MPTTCKCFLCSFIWSLGVWASHSPSPGHPESPLEREGCVGPAPLGVEEGSLEEAEGPAWRPMVRKDRLGGEGEPTKGTGRPLRIRQCSALPTPLDPPASLQSHLLPMRARWALKSLPFSLPGPPCELTHSGSSAAIASCTGWILLEGSHPRAPWDPHAVLTVSVGDQEGACLVFES